MFLRPCNYVNNDDSGTNRHRAFGKKYVFSSIPSVLAWPRQRGGSKLRSCRDFSSLHFSPGKKSARPMPGIVFRIFKGIARVEIAVVDLLPGLCFWREAPEPTVGPDRTGGRENGGPVATSPSGFLRFHGPDCGHERLLAFTCKGRHLCPACHQRRVRQTADWIASTVCHEVPIFIVVRTKVFAGRRAGRCRR